MWEYNGHIRVAKTHKSLSLIKTYTVKHKVFYSFKTQEHNENRVL